MIDALRQENVTGQRIAVQGLEAGEKCDDGEVELLFGGRSSCLPSIEQGGDDESDEHIDRGLQLKHYYY